MTPRTPSQIRSLYRRLFKQIKAQFEVPGTSGANQRLWSTHLRGLFETSRSGEMTWTDAENLAMYLESNREYMRLMALYWPSTDMTDMERVHKSAARVGLSVPGGNSHAHTIQDVQEEEERKRVRDSYGPVPSARKSLLIDRLMCLADEAEQSTPVEDSKEAVS